MQIDTACGYFIKVTRDITRIKVNHCKNIAKYVSTLDLTEECTGDVDKTYRGDCHYHDSRAHHTQHRRSCRIAHHNNYCKIAPVHASGFHCTSQFGKCSIMTILRVSALALNRHVGEPFVVSHSLPHDLLLSFFITCILQVYHPVTTTLKSEFEV